MAQDSDEQYPQLTRRLHLTKQRFEMVEHHVAARGVTDTDVLKAMSTVPREAFVPEDIAAGAYSGSPLHIGFGQTMSPPFLVGLMLEALRLKPGDRVLEIGTGTGYTAALLGQVVGEVYSVERIKALADGAALRLDRLGYRFVHVRHADGYDGWPEHAPFDVVLVTVGCASVPAPLQDQLAPGGRLVVPLGDGMQEQTLARITRGPGDGLEREELGNVAFLPMARGMYRNE